MSPQGAQSDGESIEIEDGDLISDGPDNWTVHATEGPMVPDGEVILERYDGKRFPFERDSIGRCDCGQLVLGGGQCYGCYRGGD